MFQVMKNAVLLFLVSLLVMVSCTSRKVSRTLNDVESYIMSRPDSALTVLEDIDRASLVSSGLKARHALLHSMALDKNFIDIIDDSIAGVAVEYYEDHGPDILKARSLYYYGRVKFNAGHYDEAILAYSKAEEAAEECDSLYLGMVNNAMAETYNRTYNSKAELEYARKAYDIFVDIKASQYVRIAYIYMAVAYQNCSDYEKAQKICNEIIDASEYVDYPLIEATLISAHLQMEKEHPDYDAVIEKFEFVRDEDETQLEDNDYWAWLCALCSKGDNDFDGFEGKLDKEDTSSTVASFWKYRISKAMGDDKAALHFIEESLVQQNKLVSEVLKESLATYQKDYYQALADVNASKAESRMAAIVTIVISSIFLLAMIASLLLMYIRNQRSGFEKSLEYAEEINRQMRESQREDYSRLKRQFLSLYRSRFETIGELSNQYLRDKDRKDIENVIYRKVMLMIDDIRNDRNRRHEFETMLDNDLECIMTNLRIEMPKFKEVDYALFSYLVAGFDATTISRLLDMTVNNVYARKHRIRTRIEEQQPEHIAQFLEILVGRPC